MAIALSEEHFLSWSWLTNLSEIFSFNSLCTLLFLILTLLLFRYMFKLGPTYGSSSLLDIQKIFSKHISKAILKIINVNNVNQGASQGSKLLLMVSTFVSKRIIKPFKHINECLTEIKSIERPVTNTVKHNELAQGDAFHTKSLNNYPKVALIDDILISDGKKAYLSVFTIPFRYESVSIDHSWLVTKHSATQEISPLMCIQKIISIESKKRTNYYLLSVRLLYKDQFVLLSDNLKGEYAPKVNAVINIWQLKQLLSVLTYYVSISSYFRSSQPVFWIELSRDTLTHTIWASVLESNQRLESIFSLLNLEISESLWLTARQDVQVLINKLTPYGFSFTLSGVGSNLTDLYDLPASTFQFVKIHSDFIHNLLLDPMGGSIIQSIQEAAASQGLKTIAPLVEDETTLQILQNIGVDFMYGNYCSPVRHLSEVCEEIMSIDFPIETNK